MINWIDYVACTLHEGGGGGSFSRMWLSRHITLKDKHQILTMIGTDS